MFVMRIGSTGQYRVLATLQAIGEELASSGVAKFDKYEPDMFALVAGEFRGGNHITLYRSGVTRVDQIGSHDDEAQPLSKGQAILLQKIVLQSRKAVAAS